MKELYRKKYLELRKNVQNKELKDERIYNKIIDNSYVNTANLILIYVSLSHEIDTLKIISYLLKYKQVAVPKIENNKMQFYYINSLKELKKGYFNVLEPTSNKKVNSFDNAVSITPGICYSKDLYRLGYGKGYYDKFYSTHKKIYKIGLCYRELLLNYIPHNKFDQKVDKIITD